MCRTNAYQTYIDMGSWGFALTKRGTLSITSSLAAMSRNRQELVNTAKASPQALPSVCLLCSLCSVSCMQDVTFQGYSGSTTMGPPRKQ